MQNEEDLFAFLEQEVLGIEAEVNSKLSQKSIIDEEITKVRSLLNELLGKRSAIEEAVFDNRRYLREKEAELSNADRRLKLKQENERIAAELKEKEKEYDDITATAPWRDRAMEHQHAGSTFLAVARRALCADVMGTGKTLQSLMYLDKIQAKRVLIVCPGDVMFNFAEEIKKWAPNRPAVVIGKQNPQLVNTYLSMLRNEEEFVLIANYEMWSRSWSIVDKLNDMRIDTIIVDEAHEIKNTSTKAYQGVERIVFAKNACPQGTCTARKRPDSYDCEAGHDDIRTVSSVVNVLCMTGTPILNRPTECYPSLHLINPQLFPTMRKFERDFCTMDYNSGKLVFNWGGQEQLAQRISGMYLRRTLKDAGVELPPQDIIVHEIALERDRHPLQYEIMEMLMRHAQIEIEEGRASDQMSILSLITRQRQAAVWPGGITLKEKRRDPYTGELVLEFNPKTGEFEEVYDIIPIGLKYPESAKLDRAVDLINDLMESGQRVVVFSKFVPSLKELQNRLTAERAVLFIGETSSEERNIIKRNFDRSYGETPKWDCVLANFDTGGVGVNFTSATAMIILDEEWNPGKNEQGYGRINRIGQTENTAVHILRLAPPVSIDTWLAKLIEVKSMLVGGWNDAVNMSQEQKIQQQQQLFFMKEDDQ